jgi:hypothetical protein
VVWRNVYAHVLGRRVLLDDRAGIVPVGHDQGKQRTRRLRGSDRKLLDVELFDLTG